MPERMLEVRGHMVLRDEDGTRLLFSDDVARMARIKKSTLRFYNSAAHRARAAGAAGLFPAPSGHVYRTTTKRDRKPVRVETPVWREDVIREWLRTRKGPGGRLRSDLKTRAVSARDGAG